MLSQVFRFVNISLIRFGNKVQPVTCSVSLN